MATTPRWLDRRFETGLDPSLHPNLLARLRGTPARLEEAVLAVAPARRVEPRDGAWSIQRNAGHLLDLEDLFAARVEDFRAGRDVLTPWDGTNAATDRADHDDRPTEDLLAAFRRARGTIVDHLRQLDLAAFARAARHPRLDAPMRLVDLMLFQAEHDDHHLARIHELASGG